MTEALLIAVLIVGIANLALVILLIGGRRDAARDIDRLKRDMLDEQRALRAEVSENTRRSINAVGRNAAERISARYAQSGTAVQNIRP